MAFTSSINLNLGQVPKIEDPELYRALDDIYNALNILAQAGSGTVIAGLDFNTFIAQYLNVTAVNDNYLMQVTDGLIIVLADSLDLQVTLPPASAIKGFKYIIKCDEGSTFLVTVVGSGTDDIDGYTTGITLTAEDTLMVESVETGWKII